METQPTIPPRTKDKYHNTSVRLSASLLREIDRLAKRFRTTRNQVVVAAIKDYLKHIKDAE